MYHYTDGGLQNVWLRNGYVVKKTPYGKGVSFHDLDGLIHAICTAIANKPGKLTGAEFRYLRSAMLLSQKNLGKMMGCTEQAIAKWEKQSKIPKASDFLIRILFNEAKNGSSPVNAAVETLNMIDRASNSTIIVSEKDDHWTSEVKENVSIEEIEREEAALA